MKPDFMFQTTVTVETKPWFISIYEHVRQAWNSWRDPLPLPDITAAPVEVAGLWSRHKTGVPRLLSVALHLTFVLIAALPRPETLQPLPQGSGKIWLSLPERMYIPAGPKPGGGGGGRRDPRPASLGRLPRASDRQLVPPDPEPPRNADPTLVVEASIVAPELATLPKLALFTIGDPEGIPGPPSAGPGLGYGIGTGDGRGVGSGDGPGAGHGEGGGVPGGTLHVVGGVIAPVLLVQIQPEYSEEARKARFEGTVILDTMVREDGTVQVLRVVRGVGFGLDRSAIDAVRQWKFSPGRKNGKPVPVAVNVEVTFNLR